MIRPAVYDGVPQDNVQPQDIEDTDSTSNSTHMHVLQSQEDEKKAKYLNLVRFIIVFIMCFGYFVYQMMLYNDTNYNQRQSTAIQKITSIHAPFVQVTTAVNTSSVMNCPIFVDSQHRWENNHNETETCDVIPHADDYDPYSPNWTIFYVNNEIFLIPPYNKIMTVNHTLLITLRSTDDHNSDITDIDEYLAYLNDMDNDAEESILWTETAVNDREAIDFTATTVTSLSQLMYSKTATRTDGEISVVEQNKFGRLRKRYGLDYRITDPYASNVNVVNGTWFRNTIIAMNINTLHTKTVITVDKKISFLDVLSGTGGIIGLIWPASVLITAYLLSGVQYKCIEVPGVAPNVGLDDEEKNKILIFLKEIGVVNDVSNAETYGI
eukprot:62260_1